jgi:hypothetical protein
MSGSLQSRNVGWGLPLGVMRGRWHPLAPGRPGFGCAFSQPGPACSSRQSPSAHRSGCSPLIAAVPASDLRDSDDLAELGSLSGAALRRVPGWRLACPAAGWLPPPDLLGVTEGCEADGKALGRARITTASRARPGHAVGTHGHAAVDCHRIRSGRPRNRAKPLQSPAASERATPT